MTPAARQKSSRRAPASVSEREAETIDSMLSSLPRRAHPLPGTYPRVVASYCCSFMVGTKRAK